MVDGLDAALAGSDRDLTWVIGGSEIYHLALPMATRCEVTEVEIDFRLDDDDALARCSTSPGSARRSPGRTAAPGCATGSTPSCGYDPADRRPGAPGRGGRPGSLAEPRPAGPVTRAHLRRLIGRVQVLQLDSVSVAVRPTMRAGVQQARSIQRETCSTGRRGATPRSPRLLVEYWAHEAALMSVEDWPLLRWRMREYVHGRWGTGSSEERPAGRGHRRRGRRAGAEHRGQIEAHLAEGSGLGGKGPWWDRSDTKWVAEALWSSGC